MLGYSVHEEEKRSWEEATGRRSADSCSRTCQDPMKLMMRSEVVIQRSTDDTSQVLHETEYRWCHVLNVPAFQLHSPQHAR